MNVEKSLAILDLESLNTQPSDDFAADPTTEITTLPLDSFRFIGGGSGPVLD